MKTKNTLAFSIKNDIISISLIFISKNMSSLESNINSYQSKKEYPQIKNLFEALNISESDKKKIQDEFYRTANLIYERISEISNDTISKIKLWETNRDCFTITNAIEENLVDEYFDFIHSHPHWEKIWRVLLAYYKPPQKIINSLNS